MVSPVQDEWSRILDRRGSDERDGHHLSSTPPRPSYSPVTPTIQPAGLASAHQEQQEQRRQQQQQQQPMWIDQPPAEPISLDENPDAIALRAAISILQLQREQAVKDIRTLDKLKDAALRDPQRFLEDLRSGKLSTGGQQIHPSDDEDEPSDALNASSSHQSAFGAMPTAQNVVRAPPINWAKYQVVGDSLDKLHEEQRRRPDPGEPQLFAPELRPRHVVSAPYDPFTDRFSQSPGHEHRPNAS